MQQDGLSRLEAARAQLYEAEETAHETLGHLHSQRESLQRVRGNVCRGSPRALLVALTQGAFQLKEAGTELTVSNTFLNRMGKWWRG